MGKFLHINICFFLFFAIHYSSSLLLTNLFLKLYLQHMQCEPRCNYYYNIIKEDNPEAATLVDQISRE